jgi:hypothetical protein
MKLKKHNVIKFCALLVLVAFVLYTSFDVATTTTTTSTTTSASGIIHDGAKANVRGFADENDNAVDYAEAQHGYAQREEADAEEEVRTISSSSSSKNRRRAKQKEILKTINGHAKMLPDKSPSRVYDIFTDDNDFEDSNTASSCKNQFAISDAFKNANSNGIGYSHMAMLSPLPKGSFYRWILVWQCSRGIEGTADMHLRAIFSDDLNKWMPKDGIELNVKKDKKNAVWAPVLHLDEKENVLWLFFSESVKCLRLMSPENRWSPGGNINAVSSMDGISWTKPKTLITSESESGNPKVIANKLVVHPKSKHWILPYWGEASSAKGCRSGHPTISGVLISKDQGHTWHSHGKVHPRHGRVIEGTVAVTENGSSILQLWRSKSGFLMQSTSTNGGFTWTSPRKRADLKNPDSKSSLIDFGYYVNGTSGKMEIISNSGVSELSSTKAKQNALKHVIALAYNDASSGRKKLSLAVSKSPGDGKQFVKLKEIEPGRSGVHFHYPTVIADTLSECDGKIRIIVAYSYMKRVNGWGNVYRQAKFGGIKVATVLMNA